MPRLELLVVVERSPSAQAEAALTADGVKAKGRKTFIYVNNRLEGNALSTIQAMVEMLR